DDRADGRGRRDVVVGTGLGALLGRRSTFVDGLDLLRQQGRIGGHCESPTHISHGGTRNRQGRIEAVSNWQAPSTPTPVHATVTIPGSKSLTNRALVLAALATPNGSSTVSNALRSRDTDLMIGALQTLGVVIDGAGTEHTISGAITPQPGARVDCGLAG